MAPKRDQDAATGDPIKTGSYVKEEEIHMEYHHERLKPDTPWQIRRRIRMLENETARMYAWVYRIYVAIEILTFLALLACAAHYGMRIF